MHNTQGHNNYKGLMRRKSSPVVQAHASSKSTYIYVIKLMVLRSLLILKYLNLESRVERVR